MVWMPTDRLAQCVSSVTSMMLGRTFRAATPAQQIQAWRTVVLPFSGARPISLALSSDRASCAALASAMLGIGEDDLEVPMIDDVLRELVNMTAGQVKGVIAPDHALGLPRIVESETPFHGADWTHHVLGDGSSHLVVSMYAGA